MESRLWTQCIEIVKSESEVMESVYQKFINAERVKNFDGTIRTDTIHNTEDIGDYIHCWLDRYVSRMGRIQMNMIIEMNGGVFRCMKMYSDDFGDFPINDKEIKNYQLLTYVALERFFNDRLQNDDINQ